MKFDLHCHTYFSKDGLPSPEALVSAAKKKGLDGIALTDHNTTRGWQRAQKKANELGIILIRGEEIKVKENNETVGEILAYFITKEINPQGKTTEEIIKEIKDQNGLAIISHPYHWKKPFKNPEKYKNIIDGTEAFNSRGQSKNGNEKTSQFAKENNLPITAGSDAHTCIEVGRAYVEADVKTIEELKQAIINKKVEIYGKQTNPLIHIFAGLAKLIHFFNQPK